MNLSQLEVLVAIVDTGSLTEAAEVVGLTQSAVSYSLSRLEAELGVTLLERGRQGVSVTRIGEDVLQHARSILTQVEVIRQKTGREQGLAVGKLRFGSVSNVAGRLLTGIIRDFQHKYPDIEIILFEGNPEELVEWLHTGVIDIATVRQPDAYTSSVPLVRNEVKAIVSVHHPLAAQTGVNMEQLMKEDLIGPKVEYRTLRDLLQFENLPIPKLRYQVSAYNTIFSMVRENMGAAMVPEMFIDPQMDGIVALSLTPPLFMTAYLATNLKSPATKAFLTSAHQWSKSHGFLPDVI